MSVLLTIAVIVVAAVAYVLITAATKPAVFRMTRSVRIKAPPEKLMPHVVDFHKWAEWSPWEGVPGDDLKRNYEGAPSGVGAVYSWEGKKTGVGRMEIMTATPQVIGIKLDFFKPFEAHNTAEFTFEPLNDIDLGHVTAVTWSMYGPSPFMSKVMGVFMNMDKMVGTSFEQGLAKLKAIGEG